MQSAESADPLGCRKPYGFHGAYDNQCPNRETKFKPKRKPAPKARANEGEGEG